MNQTPEEYGKEILTKIDTYGKLTKQMMEQHLKFQTGFLQRMKHIDVFYSVLMFDYVSNMYRILEYNSIKYDTPEEQQNAWLLCSGLKYSIGFPIIYTITSIPATLEDTLLNKEYSGMVLFTQTPLVSKCIFYDIIEGRFVRNDMATTRMISKSAINFNMAATICQPPIMN